MAEAANGRNDLEAIEANLERLRLMNPALDGILKMIEKGLLSREHGYALLVEELVEALERAERKSRMKRGS